MEVLDAINRTGTTIVMATHNEEIVNSMRKRVVNCYGKIVRDEAHGSYDSALFFPDAEVEAKSDTAHHVLAAATKAIEAVTSRPKASPVWPTPCIPAAPAAMARRSRRWKTR